MTVRTLIVAALLFLIPAAARAVTIEDVIALSKSGVSAEVLAAVIDADRTIFTLSADDVLALTQAGVPDAVIVKMLGSAQAFTEEAPPPLIVGVGPPPRTERPVVVVPGFVPFPVFVGVPVPAVPLTYEFKRGFGRFMNDGWVEGKGFGRFMNVR